jgi:uncharacterized protein (DUF2235 family)
MSKNIILCSDGTGKSGGSGNNTNVFNLYKAVDTQSASQIVCYNDGIGSTGSKWLRTIAGTFGFGFGRSISNLYAYLVRHYEPGDKVYMFGFSRGAATIRAIAGMIETIGLIRNDYDKILTNGRIDDIKMTFEIMMALRLYKRASRKPTQVEAYKKENTHGAIDIEMIGVWDTVSALGFPRDSTWLVIGMSKLVDKLSDWIFPHNYFNYQLDANVKNAYQALALDDDRKTFHPIVWDETSDKRPVNIEQVWFAGAHSNVGGGYPRSGIAMITLDWMMTRAKRHGVSFDESLWTDVRTGMNPSGRVYNPRTGVMVYYRFGQRHVRDLCHKRSGESILTGNPRIHESVFERINLRPYAPILPNKFDIVQTEMDSDPITYEVGKDEVKKLKRRANRMLMMRTWLYHIFTEMSVLIGAGIWYLSSKEFSQPLDSRMYNFVISILPSVTENFMYYFTFRHGWIGLTMLLTFVIAFTAQKILGILTTRTRKKINWWLFHDFK